MPVATTVVRRDQVGALTGDVDELLGRCSSVVDDELPAT
jgi:hypothetical protein